MSSWSLAVDFGTSFTVAAIEVGGQVELVEVGGSQSSQFRLPSVVWIDEDGALVVGWQAERGAALAPERLERALKQSLGDVEPLQLGRPVPVEQAVGAVIGMVAGEARRQAGGSAPERVCLTHPASWPNKRKVALRAAALQAGLEGVDLLAEPVAAARHLAGNDVAAGESVAVYDLGGGTFDTAVLRRTEDGNFEPIGVGGRDGLGGEIFDNRLARHLTGTLRESTPEDWTAIEHSPRALAAFRQEVRAAKEALSNHGAYDVVLPEVSQRSSVRLTREELEQLIQADVRDSVQILSETIEAAGLEPRDLKAIYLAGGSSRIPLVARTLTEHFARVPDMRDNPKAIVALGAAGRTAPQTARPSKPEPGQDTAAEQATQREQAQRDTAAEQATQRKQTEAEAAAAAKEAAPLRTAKKRRPRLTGKAQVGRTLEVINASSRGGDPTTLAFTWERRAAAGGEATIPGCTDTKFVLSPKDLGAAVRARISATGPHGKVTMTTPWSAAVRPARSFQRRKPLLLSAAGALVAAAIITTVIAIGGGYGTIHVGPGLTGLAVGEGGVWVTNAIDGTVTRIDARSGKAVGNPISVGRTATRVAVGEGAVWVTNRSDSTVRRIDPRSGTVVGSPISVSDAGRGVAVGEGAVWVTSSDDDTVTQIDARSGKVVGDPIRFGRGEGHSGVAVGEGAVWVTSSDDDTVTQIDARSRTVYANPYGVKDASDVAVGYGAVWVTSYEDETVTRIDARAGKVVGDPISVGNGVSGVAVGYGAVWVANYEDDTVTRIDARSGNVVGDPIRVGEFPQGIAVGQGAVWVTNVSDAGSDTTDGTVTRIDANSGEVGDGYTEVDTSDREVGGG